MEKRLATPVQRVVAYLIDHMVYVALFVFLASKVSTQTDFYRILDAGLSGISIYIYFLALFPLINIFLMSKFGGTVGKLLVGIRVEVNGVYPSFGLALFRNYIGYMISGSVAFLGFFWALADKKKQTWHDMMVDSLVVVKNNNLIWVGSVVLIALTYLNYNLGSEVISKIMTLTLF